MNFESGITLESIVLNRIEAYSREHWRIFRSNPSWYAFNLLSIRYNTGSPADGLDRRFDYGIQSNSTLGISMWSRFPNSYQILLDFIILHKTPTECLQEEKSESQWIPGSAFSSGDAVSSSIFWPTSPWWHYHRRDGGGIFVQKPSRRGSFFKKEISKVHEFAQNLDVHEWCTVGLNESDRLVAVALV